VVLVRSPWAELKRAARELTREGRRAVRKTLEEDPPPKRSRPDAGRETEQPSPESTASARPAERQPEAEPATPPEQDSQGAAPAPEAPDRFAVAGAALAGISALAIAAQVVRRRRAAAPSVARAAVEAVAAPPPPAPATAVDPVAAPEPAPVPAKAPRSFGEGPRYEILERIGAGGMGVVYRARDRRLSREVALKRLSEQLIDHPKAVRYFLREARAVAGLSHPNIVTLYDVDEEDGVPFLTMELLHGRNLSQIVSARGPFSGADTARLGLQAAAGLACAHRQGIVHRDVKSANLFLTRGYVLKVMDFGLATMAEELRRAGTALGTPQYMAPEQASGAPADHRVDLYALGVTLFHLSTGTWPFEGGDVVHHHRHTPPPDPRTRRADLAPPLAELILACMAKEPDKRPATAEEVAGRLQQIARGQPEREPTGGST
jgi:tRNA A-37 threonylcarbamoyl transferase component Bud32